MPGAHPRARARAAGEQLVPALLSAGRALRRQRLAGVLLGVRCARVACGGPTCARGLAQLQQAGAPLQHFQLPRKLSSTRSQGCADSARRMAPAGLRHRAGCRTGRCRRRRRRGGDLFPVRQRGRPADAAAQQRPPNLPRPAAAAAPAPAAPDAPLRQAQPLVSAHACCAWRECMRQRHACEK